LRRGEVSEGFTRAKLQFAAAERALGLAVYAAFRDGQRVATVRDISCTGVPAPLAADAVPKPTKKVTESIEK